MSVLKPQEATLSMRCIQFVFFATAFLFFQIAQAESWREVSKWVTDLDADDQAVVIVLLRGDLNTNLVNVVLPATRNDPKNLAWLIKTQATGNFMLSRLATRHRRLKNILNNSYEDSAMFVRGEITAAEYQRRAGVTSKEMLEVIDQIDDRKAEHTAKQYRLRLHRTSLALIAYAKSIAADAGNE